jgi:hypothetical protein
MKSYMIEAYGGQGAVDGPIAHFTVNASTIDEAIELVREGQPGRRFGRIEVIEESEEFEGGGPGVVAEGAGAYMKPT